MVVLTISITGFLLYLIYERLSVDRWRRSIPLVITVTGTRGKSSVTRLLASVLREDGRRVLAKTTGAEPKLLWPAGTETEVRRRGAASIIEQKSLLKTAANDFPVDCVIAEVMSIRPENHIVESQRILKPDIVAITNFWPDHVDALGKTEDENARCLSLDIPGRATVFTASGSRTGVLELATEQVGGQFLNVQEGQVTSALESIPKLANREFAENLDLVWSVASHIGVNDETIRKGLTAAPRDIGAFSIWDWRSERPQRRLFAVNGFSANDPESTIRVLAKVEGLIPATAQLPVGLLCLRADRGDRTEQWIHALEDGVASRFSRIYVNGGHARVMARRLDSAVVLTESSPERLMQRVVAENTDDTILFGFGNIMGTGRQLVDYWDSTGVVHGI